MLPFSQTKQRDPRLTHSLNSASIPFNRGFGNFRLPFRAPLVRPLNDAFLKKRNANIRRHAGRQRRRKLTVRILIAG